MSSPLAHSRSFRLSKRISRYLDDYYLDGIIGLFPVAGDMLGLGFHTVYLYIAAFKLRSWRLTVVMLFNAAKDALIGMIPAAGWVLDFFYRANRRNFALIEGFAANDADTVRQVNRQAGMALAGLLILAAIGWWLIKLAWTAAAHLWQWLAG